MQIHIVNGPNLNLLGKREPEVYGSETFEDFFDQLKKEFAQVEFTYFQSNVEGEIVNRIQEVGFGEGGIILNAAAYTHTSVAIGDAVGAVPAPVIEVHISNVYARESYRHESKIAAKCAGVIAGFGLDSYRLAVQHLLRVQ